MSTSILPVIDLISTISTPTNIPKRSHCNLRSPQCCFHSYKLSSTQFIQISSAQISSATDFPQYSSNSYRSPQNSNCNFKFPQRNPLSYNLLNAIILDSNLLNTVLTDLINAIISITNTPQSSHCNFKSPRRLKYLHLWFSLSSVKIFFNNKLSSQKLFLDMIVFAMIPTSHLWQLKLINMK